MCFFFKNAGQKTCTKFFFSFFKQIKKLGWKVFEKTFHPIFSICLYFIGVGGDENQKKIGIALVLTFVLGA